MSRAPAALRGAVTDTEEEALLRAAVAAIAAKCALGHDANGHGACWSALTGSGFNALRFPGDDGRAMAPMSSVLVVVEELARSLCGAPVLAAGVIAPELLRLAGAPGEDIDARCGAGVGLVLTASLTSMSAGGGTDVGWDCGGTSEAVAVTGSRLMAVNLGGDVKLADHSRTIRYPMGSPRVLGFDISPADLVRATAVGRLAVAADALGAAGALLDAALDYARDRVQFGVPIGSFQAIQHLCAEAFVKLEALRSSMLYAAWAIDEGELGAADEAARVAKAYAAVTAVEVVHAATQVFGGVAITWEHPAHRHLRRVVVDRLVLGDDDLLLRELAAPSGGR